MSPSPSIRGRRRQRGPLGPWLAVLRASGVTHPDSPQAAAQAVAAGFVARDLSGVLIHSQGPHAGRLALVFDRPGEPVRYAYRDRVEASD